MKQHNALLLSASGWKKYHDPSTNKQFYYNPQTGETSWTCPEIFKDYSPDLTEVELKIDEDAINKLDKRWAIVIDHHKSDKEKIVKLHVENGQWNIMKWMMEAEEQYETKLMFWQDIFLKKMNPFQNNFINIGLTSNGVFSNRRKFFHVFVKLIPTLQLCDYIENNNLAISMFIRSRSSENFGQRLTPEAKIEHLGSENEVRACFENLSTDKELQICFRLVDSLNQVIADCAIDLENGKYEYSNFINWWRLPPKISSKVTLKCGIYTSDALRGVEFNCTKSTAFGYCSSGNSLHVQVRLDNLSKHWKNFLGKACYGVLYSMEMNKVYGKPVRMTRLPTRSPVPPPLPDSGSPILNNEKILFDFYFMVSVEKYILDDKSLSLLIVLVEETSKSGANENLEDLESKDPDVKSETNSEEELQKENAVAFSCLPLFSDQEVFIPDGTHLVQVFEGSPEVGQWGNPTLQVEGSNFLQSRMRKMICKIDICTFAQLSNVKQDIRIVNSIIESKEDSINNVLAHVVETRGALIRGVKDTEVWKWLFQLLETIQKLDEVAILYRPKDIKRVIPTSIYAFFDDIVEIVYNSCKHEMIAYFRECVSAVIPEDFLVSYVENLVEALHSDENKISVLHKLSNVMYCVEKDWFLKDQRMTIFSTMLKQFNILQGKTVPPSIEVVQLGSKMICCIFPMCIEQENFHFIMKELRLILITLVHCCMHASENVELLIKNSLEILSFIYVTKKLSSTESDLEFGAQMSFLVIARDMLIHCLNLIEKPSITWRIECITLLSSLFLCFYTRKVPPKVQTDIQIEDGKDAQIYIINTLFPLIQKLSKVIQTSKYSSTMLKLSYLEYMYQMTSPIMFVNVLRANTSIIRVTETEKFMIQAFRTLETILKLDHKNQDLPNEIIIEGCKIVQKLAGAVMWQISHAFNSTSPVWNAMYMCVLECIHQSVLLQQTKSQEKFSLSTQLQYLLSQLSLSENGQYVSSLNNVSVPKKMFYVIRDGGDLPLMGLCIWALIMHCRVLHKYPVSVLQAMADVIAEEFEKEENLTDACLERLERYLADPLEKLQVAEIILFDNLKKKEQTVPAWYNVLKNSSIEDVNSICTQFSKKFSVFSEDYKMVQKWLKDPNKKLPKKEEDVKTKTIARILQSKKEITDEQNEGDSTISEQENELVSSLISLIQTYVDIRNITSALKFTSDLLHVHTTLQNHLEAGYTILLSVSLTVNEETIKSVEDPININTYLHQLVIQLHFDNILIDMFKSIKDILIIDRVLKWLDSACRFLEEGGEIGLALDIRKRMIEWYTFRRSEDSALEQLSIQYSRLSNLYQGVRAGIGLLASHCRYVSVQFFGTKFPKRISKKRFIYKLGYLENYYSFKNRLLREYPNAQIIPPNKKLPPLCPEQAIRILPAISEPLYQSIGKDYKLENLHTRNESTAFYVFDFQKSEQEVPSTTESKYVNVGFPCKRLKLTLEHPLPWLSRRAEVIGSETSLSSGDVANTIWIKSNLQIMHALNSVTSKRFLKESDSSETDDSSLYWKLCASLGSLLKDTMDVNLNYVLGIKKSDVYFSLHEKAESQLKAQLLKTWLYQKKKAEEQNQDVPEKPPTDNLIPENPQITELREALNKVKTAILKSKLFYMKLLKKLESVEPDTQKLKILGKQDIEMLLADRFWSDFQQSEM